MSCAPPITFKQGDTFAGSALYTSDGTTPMDLTNWTITSQVRDKRTWKLVATVVFTLEDQAQQPGKASFEADVQTLHWPSGQYVWDVKFSHPGAATNTQTQEINIVRAVTGGPP